MLKKLIVAGFICMGSTMAVANQTVQCPSIDLVKQYELYGSVFKEIDGAYSVRSDQADLVTGDTKWYVGVSSIKGVLSKIEAMFRARLAVHKVVKTTYPAPAEMGDYYVCQYSGADNGTVVLMGHK